MRSVSRASSLALLAVIALSLYGCASVARREDPRLAFARGIAIIQRHGMGKAGAAGIAWIRRAAHEDLALAQDRLGLMYLYGTGVKQSTPRALEWLRRAAQRGAPAAQLQLGSLYSAGNCAPRNDLRAYYWLSIAAKPQTSSVHICNILDVRRFARGAAQGVARRLTAAQLAAVDRRVVRWTPTASVPYGGVVVLTRWVCTRPTRKAAAGWP
jgi:TPR repeat protein